MQVIKSDLFRFLGAAEKSKIWPAILGLLTRAIEVQSHQYYRKDTEPFISFYVLTCITSFQHLSITCNALIACYITYQLLTINQGVHITYYNIGND